MSSPEIAIVKLEPRRMGEEVLLTVRISTGEHEQIEKLTVSTSMLSEIGNIGFDVLPYALTKEKYDTLEYDASLWEAVRKGLDILSYGDNTRSVLITKLRQRGFDKYISEDAAEYICSLGYIDEKRILEKYVDQLANVKLYGRSRIKNELYKKGISREVLDNYLSDMLDEIDFEENLCCLIRKKCDYSRLDDPKYRESLYAAMYRYGYSPSDTRAAIKATADEDDE